MWPACSDNRDRDLDINKRLRAGVTGLARG